MRWTKKHSLLSTTGTATVLPSTHANLTSADVSSGSCPPVYSDSYCPVLKPLTNSISISFSISVNNLVPYSQISVVLVILRFYIGVGRIYEMSVLFHCK